MGVSVTTGTGVAIVLPSAAPALIPPPEQPARSTSETKLSWLTAPAREAKAREAKAPEAKAPEAKAESTSESTSERGSAANASSPPVAMVPDRRAADADADEQTAWGLTPVATRLSMPPNPGQSISGLQPVVDETEPLPPSMSAAAFRTGWFSAGRKLWLVSGAAAAALVGVTSCWMLWGAELQPSLGKDPMQALVSPPPAVASIPAPAQSVESPPALAAETGVEPGPAEVAASNPVAPNQAPAGKAASSGAKDLRAAFAAKLAGNKAKAGTRAADGAGSVSYDEAKVEQSVSAAVRKAEQCDLWGRVTGTAQLSITYAPSGRVSRAHLVGEPIASAPVARCILHHARASSVPAFKGRAITVSRKITLR